ncbi:hypothetical protein ACFY9S_15470 [Streptomyces sp. NPDC012474]|uniref:hypothetical protein n=1 Tax=Streptomyces sp. NPDC012474 TaxID=3364836 RepID=UPI0036EAD6BD
MHDLIPRALHRLRLFFAPGAGKRRGGRPRRHLSPHVHLTLVSCPSAPQPPQLPRHRSPYGLHSPLDGNTSPVVRRYVAADLGIDLDRHLIGAGKVAA